MGSIKQKEKINENPDDDIYCYPVWKTRTQELANRMRQREFAGSDDVQPMVKKVGGTFKSEEHLPDTGKETMSNKELNKQRESRNKFQIDIGRGINNMRYVHTKRILSKYQTLYNEFPNISQLVDLRTSKLKLSFWHY